MREQPGSEPTRRRLTNVLSQLADRLRDDRPDEAISLHRRAGELIEPIAHKRPWDLAVLEELSRSSGDTLR